MSRTWATVGAAMSIDAQARERYAVGVDALLTSVYFTDRWLVDNIEVVC